MKLFFNKFFLICLCVALVFCAVPLTLTAMGYRGLAGTVVNTLTAPARFCAAGVANAVSGIGRYFTSLESLWASNAALREENAALREDLDRLAILEDENERLRAYLELKTANPDFELLDTTVIGRSADSNSHSFTLNRGSLHGIEVGMPVITEAGLVGVVSAVNLNNCLVEPILHAGGSVGAYVPRSGAVGIVSGDYSLAADNLCLFSYTQNNADFDTGDRVCSSGLGSLYPADLPIGEIISTETDLYGRKTTATVRLWVNPDSVTHVMILTGFASESTGE